MNKKYFPATQFPASLYFEQGVDYSSPLVQTQLSELVAKVRT